LKKLFKEKLTRKDYRAVLFTGQAWASLINLQKDNVALVAHVPKAKFLFLLKIQKTARGLLAFI
jgi:hypothetical protein